MSVFAFIVLCAAAIIDFVRAPRGPWIALLIVIGIVLALVVTSGTQVTVH